MKKIYIYCISIIFTFLVFGCKSVSDENAYYSHEYINQYYATSDEDCNFIFEFINQSNKSLKLEGYIAETTKLINNYDPLITTSIFVIKAGECKTFKINANKLIKDFNKNYSIGINCFEKDWHWWQQIDKSMKNNRFRVVVKNDAREGGQIFNPSFKSANKFEINEIAIEYEKRNYLSYLLTETPDEYKELFDTRILYKNNSNNYNRVSNLYTCSCKDLVQELLDKGEFTVKFFEGYQCLLLNMDPLDLNNYIANDDYDFIYEIVNNTDEKILAANILVDEESQVLTLANDVEIEPGKSFQLKFNLETLKKIYGKNARICLDVKKINSTQWIRGMFADFNHQNEKYTVVISEGTQGQALDMFDLWSDFLQL